MGNQKFNGDIIITGKLNPNDSGYGFNIPDGSSLAEDKTIATTDQVDLKADKVGPLPHYNVNTPSMELVLDFLSAHPEANESPIILTVQGTPYIGRLAATGPTSYIFEFKHIGSSNIRYATSAPIDLTGLTFNNILSSTYQDNYELQKNKVALGSTNTTDQYPNAKSVWDECQDIREVAEGKCSKYIMSYTDTIANIKSTRLSGGKFYVYNYTTGELEDKTAELMNGDYDNINISNAHFNTSDDIMVDNGLVVFGKNIFYHSRTNTWYGDRILYEYGSPAPFSKGDIFYIVELNVSDRWFSELQEEWGFLKLETTKVDLSNYYTKAEVDALLEANKNLEEITYSTLKSKRDNSQLIPGRFYRITDYQFTTTQVGTSSAGHQFDIIVRADSTNILNEEASAIKHAGDTYFVNSNLAAWKLRYCLDNNSFDYKWADTTNGKGIIYQMIDEFGNACPYDFKNLTYHRGPLYRFSCEMTGTGVTTTVYIYCTDRNPTTSSILFFNTYFSADTDSPSWKINSIVSTTADSITINCTYYGNTGNYTFTYVAGGGGQSSYFGTTDEFYTFTRFVGTELTDASLNLAHFDSTAEKDAINCYNNILKHDYYSMLGKRNFSKESDSYGYWLPNIVISTRYNNTAYNICNNLIENGCNNINAAGIQHFEDNKIEHGCKNIIFYANSAGDNHIGFDCNKLAFSNISNSILGSNCSNIDIWSISNSNIGNYSSYISSSVSELSFIHIGKWCSYINFAKSYTNYITIDDDCNYITIDTDSPTPSPSQFPKTYLSHVHVHMNTKGTSTAQKIIKVDREAAGETNVYAANSRDIILND